MRDAVTLVLITEDLCAYNDVPGSADRGTYEVSMPTVDIPQYLTPTFAVSGLFKDIDGYTHKLETLKLQWNEQHSILVGTWEELGDGLNVPFILKLEPTSDTKAKMSISTDVYVPTPE